MITTPSLTLSEPTPFDAASFAAHALSSPAALAAVLDHTLLKPEATRAQVIHLCHEAVSYTHLSGAVEASVSIAWCSDIQKRVYPRRSTSRASSIEF